MNHFLTKSCCKALCKPFPDCHRATISLLAEKVQTAIKLPIIKACPWITMSHSWPVVDYIISLQVRQNWRLSTVSINSIWIVYWGLHFGLDTWLNLTSVYLQYNVCLTFSDITVRMFRRTYNVERKWCCLQTICT